MPAGKDQDVAIERPKPRHDLIDPLGDLQDGLAAGTPVAEQFPVGALSMDVCERPSLVITVIPFEQPGVEHGLSGKSGELTGPQRPPQRTRQHVIELQVFEPRTQRTSLVLAPGRERKISAPGVLTRDTPGGLSVPDQMDIVLTLHGATVCRLATADSAASTTASRSELLSVVWGCSNLAISPVQPVW